jgi:DeoR-like helix-turn-helix domain
MLPKTGKKLPGRNDRDGWRATYAGIVADALATELGDTHRAAKILMGWTGAGERTVKHWLAGAHGPGSGHLLVLMRESEEVFRAVVAACGRSDRASVERTSSGLDRRSHPTGVSPVDQGTDWPVAERVARAGTNDRDHDRIRDRNDDRDQAGAVPRSGGSGHRRQAWFLEAVAAGRPAAAVDIVDHWDVSEKTARRDIAALTASGLIRFVGTLRSGRYRLSHA